MRLCAHLSAFEEILHKRLYEPLILRDLQKKMVFLGGARQVGKTTLAQALVEGYRDHHPAYLNWDNELHREIIRKQEWSKLEKIIIFDELHKRKGWQSFIKGIYDVWKNSQKFIVAGSARLDLYRKGGDSLLGRYQYYRIHPFSITELGGGEDSLKDLFRFGGFPEPLFEKDETELRRWHVQRVAKLVRHDLRDLEQVSDIHKVELLALSLPERVGSLLSLKSLAEDLEVSDKTVKRWVQILETLYYCYRVAPYAAPKIKAIKKSQKLYLWDWSQIENEGARFENMVASHLLKLCQYWEDALGFKAELRFLRNDQGKECDFVVIKDRKILFAVECKLNSTDVSESCAFLKSKLKIPMWYQVHMETATRTVSPDYKILPFKDFAQEVGLV